MPLKKKEKTKTKSGGNRIPKNVMESIPYRSVYPNGVIEDYDGRFSKSYRLMDVNFDTEEEIVQENMVLAYERLLNCVDENTIGQLTIINRSVDQDVVRNSILMKPKKDDVNNLRNEWNDMFLEKLNSGKNNLAKDKLFTISVAAPDIKSATDILKRTDHDISKNVRRINHQETFPLTIAERLELFYDIYRCDEQVTFTKRIEPLMKDGKLDLDTMAKYGMSSKELIAPDSMEFKRNFILFGDDMYAKAFYLDRLPTQLSTSILNDISDIPCNMIASVTFIQMDQDQGMQLVKNQSTGMNAQINKMQADAAKQGIGNAGVVSTELENARDQATELMNDILKRNQKMFKVTPIIVLFAKTKEELNGHVAMLKSIVAPHSCLLRSMNYQEEYALNTALPLAQMQLENTDRIMTSESASVYMPFNVQDINQMGGVYYGINPLSGNMIRYDRTTGANYNAMILGSSGSGKSFFIKEEISQIYLNSDKRLIIIDPQGEYAKMGKAFKATVIDISLNSKSHINPLDMDIQFGGEGENPIPMKCDAIETLIECMMGGANSISPIEKSIIHRVGKSIYRGYYKHMQEMAYLHGITCDKAAMPTLQDFYAELCKQPEPQAQYMATAIESYCVGNYAIFAERTNVDTENRMIIYDVSRMTSGMKELAMHVCMNDAWNHIISNGLQGIYTALYIDEFHLFTKTRTSAAFMKNIYKTARKWKGMPTAITQNISDFYVNDEAEAIANNCSFVVMMNQSPTDRATLQGMYSISSQLIEHITDQPPGNGLIYNGNTTVPMEGDFPTNTRMYALMDSRQMGQGEEETA